MSCNCNDNQVLTRAAAGPTPTSAADSSSGSFKDPVGRILWRDGQVLASRDLRGETDDAARRRILHNRYIHGAWGIATGFTVQLASGGVSVLISPGYAIDAAGNDLLQPQYQQLPLPPDGTFLLTVAFGAPVAWIPIRSFDNGVHVPLARVAIMGGQLSGALDLSVRRLARRMVRPHVGSGITETGATNWTDVAVHNIQNVWLEADIDTSGSGFLATPRYIASISRQGPAHPHPRTGSLEAAAAPFGSLPAFSLDGIAVITAASPQGFTFRMPRGTLPFGVDITAAEAEAGGWVVAWLGLEPAAGCAPLVNLQSDFIALGISL